MQIPGRVQNGVVIFDGDATLPEGARVVVFPLSPTGLEQKREVKKLELPLVRSGKPGSIHLTNEQICEILDDEDIENMKRTWDVPS